MKIILEGTEAEFINVLHSFGIPNEVVFDDGNQFLCGDIAGRGHRKKSTRTFKVIKEQIGDIAKDYSSSKEVPNKPEPESLSKIADEYIVDYHRRSGAEVPIDVKEMPYVSKDDIKNALKQLQKLAYVSSKIRNMKLSELIYITNQASVHNHHV